ncbi:hypothetical protein MUU74_08615 [Chryseobacterium daecheongense]|uniref:hypothetical protein n=1 Tax=Chryseobacterium daecheongense TaxID=192389 RepID=UPI001FD6C300|nr:hypothetical protein [Chryseobacterium daecheongense]UOV00004.1 hypothetical protein MUU74_08615 [Chryseobacterium daecheongense]
MGKATKKFSAKQIMIRDLHEQLILLHQNKTEFEFIGINSNGDDCIYFAKEGQNYNIEYEAVEKTQLPYFEKIKSFASRNNYSYSEKINNGIPYLIVHTNTGIDQTIKLAEQIQIEIFGNNENTVYEIVP